MGLGRLLGRIWRFFHPQWTAMSSKQIADIDRAVAEGMAKGSFTTRERAPTAPTADQLWSADATEEAVDMQSVRGGASTHGGTSVHGSMSVHGGGMSVHGGGMSVHGGGMSVHGGGMSVHEGSNPYASRGETPPVYSSRPYYTTTPTLSRTPTPGPNDRLWSMSSHGGAASVVSSRGRDSGYGEWQRPSSVATARKPPYYQHNSYYSTREYQYPRQYDGSYGQQRGYYEAQDRYPAYYEQPVSPMHQRRAPQYPAPSYCYPHSGGVQRAGGYVRASPPSGMEDEDDGVVAGQPMNAPF